MMNILNELNNEEFQMVIKNKLIVHKTKKEEKGSSFSQAMIFYSFILQELRNCGPLF